MLVIRPEVLLEVPQYRYLNIYKIPIVHTCQLSKVAARIA